MSKTKIKGRIITALLLLALAALCCTLCACGEVEVCFDANYQGGGKITQTVSDGKLSPPTNVSREGYLFDGWHLDKNCTQKLTEAVVPQNGDVYYAKWIALPQSLSATCEKQLFAGDVLTKEDLTVTVTYSDGNTKVLQPSEFTADLAIVTQSAGQRSAVVSYAENSAELHALLTVEVQSVKLASISATYTGGKIFVGGTISESDFSVAGVYNNGATGTVGQFEIIGFSSQTAGQKTVKITAGAVSCDVTVEVVQPKPLSVSATYDGKVAVGAQLDESKFEVIVTFDNGETQRVKEFTVSGFSSQTVGNCAVTVSCTVEGVALSAQCSVPVAVAKLTGISAEYLGSAVFVNGSLDLTKITVTATYDLLPDKSVGGFWTEGFSSATVGEKQVKVCYNEGGVTKHDFVTVQVVAAILQNVSVQPQSGVSVFVGQTLNHALLTVTATYTNGSSRAVTEFTDNLNSSSAGEKSVTISYTENGVTKTATLTVQVVTPVLSGIAVQPQTGVSVFVGQRLNHALLTVTATYTDGSSRAVTEFTDNLNSSSAGEKNVTISYTENGVTKTATLTVQVVTPVLSSISVRPQSGISVFVGQTLNHALLTVTATYTDGSSRAVTEFTDNLNSSSAGEKNVTISYTEGNITKTATVTVSVLAVGVQSLQIQLNAEEPCVVNREFNRNHLVVVGVCNNGDRRTLQNYGVSGFSVATAGEITLTISVEDVSANVTVTIPVLPMQIAATYVGNAVPKGLTVAKQDFRVTATYNDGSQSSVSDFLLGAFAADSVGTKQIEIQHQGLTTSVAVQVVAPVITGISAAKGTKNIYVGDAEFEKTMLVVTAQYSDGTTQTVSDYSVSGFDTASAGNITLTVTGAGKTAQIVVSVLAVQATGISVRYNGASVVQFGSELNKSDIVVTATYNNGTTAVVGDFTTNFDGNKSGEQTVTVSYTLGVTKTATFTVTVYAQLQTISAQYKGGNVAVGGALNNSKIAVTATYADGSSRAVANFNVGAFSSALEGTQTVEISYSELNPATNETITKSATVNVVVVEQSVTSQGQFSAHFLELGNKYTGDSIYIKAGETDILIDAGSRENSAATIAAYVDNYCTDGKLEYVIATHAHQDHIAGFVGTSTEQGIFEKYECENIIEFARHNTTSNIYNNYCAKRDAEVAAGANLFTALDCYNNANGGQRIYDLTGDGSITMEILYQKYYETKASSENDYSVCVMFHQGENHYLFTGDLEEAGEKSLVESNPNLPEVVLYKAGHHGSGTSSSETLLEKIKPQYVCICCCTGTTEYTDTMANTFPYQVVVDRIAKYTDRVYATTLSKIAQGTDGKWKYDNFESLNGDIVFSCINGVISVNGSNNNLKLKDTEWFKTYRTCPVYWQEGTATPSLYHD